MKSILNKLKTDEQGVVSVEFALIAPMMIFGALVAINLGYQVNKHQKLAASITAGSNYLQNYAFEENLNDMRPNWNSDTNLASDSGPIETAKLVIQSAYGSDLELDEIYINTYCGCPNNKVPDGGGGTEPDPDEYEIATEQSGSSNNNSEFDFANPQKDYYTKTKMSLWRKGELCAYDCPSQNGRARVLMDIDIQHSLHDLFGKEIVIYETLKTRLR